MKEKLQRFGGFLAGMIIPNIGAFIAWGLITALFIPTGWTPSEKFSELVGPMIVYLLPILIGYTGGKMIHGVRGGVVGATATMGVVVGGGIPMFLGGMIMGPLGGWLIKKIDGVLEDRIPVGFEMLINNFSAGILAVILVLFGNIAIGPVVNGISTAAGALVDVMVSARLLPLAAIVIEPAKVLFLNNALNHGVLAPLGVASVEQSGKAIHFLLETNPGPGLGLLVAFYVAGKGMLKDSAPGSMIIHFLGGIHEIYFPYVLAHPIMILAMIAGGFSADLWFTITGAGLVATPSPGSIFAYLAVIPKGQHFAVLTGVAIGALVSFLVGSFILKVRPVRVKDNETETDEEELGSVPGLG
ncbi:MAG: PTS mannose transporter subunit IIA [Chloroflexi bacterium HGW-Chloroflexi-3]|nr:MAG: PTS mannose transporter subunit IIA [Chloroflexi bacterium HGW-Chloroflexi-3]